MNKKLLLLALLMLSGCLHIGRGEAFYRKKCLYNPKRIDTCESFYHLAKIEKTPEQKVEATLKPEVLKTKIEEPKPAPKASSLAQKTEEKKSEEQLKYEKWVQSIEASVGVLDPVTCSYSAPEPLHSN